MAICHVYPENAFVHGGIFTLLCPLPHLEGVRFSDHCEQAFLSVPLGLHNPRPRDHSVSCSPLYKDAVPHRFSPGTAVLAVNLFLMQSGHVSTFTCEIMGS